MKTGDGVLSLQFEWVLLERLSVCVRCGTRGDWLSEFVNVSIVWALKNGFILVSRCPTSTELRRDALDNSPFLGFPTLTIRVVGSLLPDLGELVHLDEGLIHLLCLLQLPTHPNIIEVERYCLCEWVLEFCLWFAI